MPPHPLTEQFYLGDVACVPYRMLTASSHIKLLAGGGGQLPVLSERTTYSEPQMAWEEHFAVEGASHTVKETVTSSLSAGISQLDSMKKSSTDQPGELPPRLY